MLTIYTITNIKSGYDAIVKYGCPITTWLDVSSTKDPTVNPSSFETICKVTEHVDYDDFAD